MSLRLRGVPAVCLLLSAPFFGGCRSAERVLQAHARPELTAGDAPRGVVLGAAGSLDPSAEVRTASGEFQRRPSRKPAVALASAEGRQPVVTKPESGARSPEIALQFKLAGDETEQPRSANVLKQAAHQPPAPEAPPRKPGAEPGQLHHAGTSVRPIDLSTSLMLVSGRNPQVAFVHERVREACAQLQAAEALWMPSIRAGANYNKHEGSFQDVAGTVFGVSRGSLYTGFGARAVGAGSPAVPGLSAQFHLADAIFQPIIAERTVTARQHAATAATNDQLLRAALAHLDLLYAVGRFRIAHETHTELDRLAKLTASFAKRGQGTRADADRARTELDLQSNAIIRAEADVQKAAARLAEVLSLDDAVSLRPAEDMIVRVELVSAESNPEALIAQALEQRPELSENLLEQSAAVQRYRRERYSPLLPHVGAGVSWGGFGGGVGDTVRHYKDRLDLDLWAYWEVRNLGFGERAARDAAHSRVHQTQHRYTRITNRVRREVIESLAELRSAIEQLRQAKTAKTSAEASLKRNFQRIREGQGLPLEVLQSIRALNAANGELLNAYVAHNRAQFQLHHALGWPQSRLD